VQKIGFAQPHPPLLLKINSPLLQLYFILIQAAIIIKGPVTNNFAFSIRGINNAGSIPIPFNVDFA